MLLHENQLMDRTEQEAFTPDTSSPELRYPIHLSDCTDSSNSSDTSSPVLRYLTQLPDSMNSNNSPDTSSPELKYHTQLSGSTDSTSAQENLSKLSNSTNSREVLPNVLNLTHFSDPDNPLEFTVTNFPLPQRASKRVKD